MAGFYLVQGGTTLKLVTTSGGLTSLTLPTGVTLDSSKRMRGVVVNGLAVLVNSPSENLTVDRFGNVRILCPRPPSAAPVLSATASGSLTGTYTDWITYFIEDLFGNIIAESYFSPISNSQAVSSEYLTTTLPLSNQDITGRKLYRSTTNGTTKFPWFDIKDNTQTSIYDDLSDASLQLIAAPTDLGTPPSFEIVASWKDRLWGKSADDVDTLYYSGINKPYGFPSTNTIPIPPKNNDYAGITGFVPRKDILGVGRRDSLHRITSSGNNVFTRVSEAEGIGIWATDSVQVIHDVGYFLGNPFGIYTWGSGVTNISNPKVKAWFETDTYFNRSRFDKAIGMYDPTTHSYVLFISAAGSTDLDRWIQYDIANDTWWGPHKTGEFTPTFCATLRDGNDIAIAVIGGSDGKLYKTQTTKTDGSSTAIDFDVTTTFVSAGNPNTMKLWLQPVVRTKVQSDGDLTITPTVGDTDASAGSAITHDMTLGSETLRRLGKGELCKLRFRETTAGQSVVIYGIELPFNEIGYRS